ncbi:MAG: GGDEF domain-containing protein [Planctomycetota bacterium]|nr:GGDEF domain-containing protein [Planctomycetota bacterium]
MAASAPASNPALRTAEALAPFACGLLLLGCGLLSAAHTLKLGSLPAGPMAGSSLTVALLVAGAGLGILFASIELFAQRRETERALAQAQRAAAERDLALLQARRLRAQAEGLALMREIHRSTSIPEQFDRLHRILTLVSDLFEAREVALFAAAPDGPMRVTPAACLRSSSEEEIYVAFEPAAMERIHEGSTGSGSVKVPKARDATLVCEGCKAFAEGSIVAGEMTLARVAWQRTLGSHESAGRQNPSELIESLMLRLDYGPPACRHAAQALEQRRTLHERVPSSLTRHHHGDETLMLCVPLIADQRSVGVLRIRRSAEGFDGPIAETFEEMLIESAKHIALAMKKDQDDRKAITDQLTGLFIKRHFLSTMEDLRAQAAAGGGLGRPFALVLLDIDHFKRVNDTHGHLSGDLVLKNVAGVLKKGLRSGDLAFRYGGEEMAVLMPGGTQEAAEQTAERLRAAVEASVFQGEKGQTIPVTVSLGIALHRHGLTGEQLISRADRALYASKHGGRNRVTAWRPDLPDPLEAKKALPPVDPTRKHAPVPQS